MKSVISLFLLLGCYSHSLSAQTITMSFPHFAGKNYDFVLFKGDKTVTIPGVIPANGAFELTVPPDMAPYTGMSRWLITQTQEGGGLDMVLNKQDFKVSSDAEKPSDNTIHYSGNDEVTHLNTLHRTQQAILDKYAIISQAVNLYDKEQAIYPVLQQEYTALNQAFDDFQKKLDQDSSYAARFLRIVNLTRGISTRLEPDQTAHATLTKNFIVHDLNPVDLYHSGHWGMIMNSFVDIHTQLLKNDTDFVADFTQLGSRMTDKAMYTAFVKQMTTRLKQTNKTLIDKIKPIVMSSGKLDSFEGDLAIYKSPDPSSTSATDLPTPASTEAKPTATTEEVTLTDAKPLPKRIALSPEVIAALAAFKQRRAIAQNNLANDGSHDTSSATATNAPTASLPIASTATTLEQTSPASALTPNPIETTAPASGVTPDPIPQWHTQLVNQQRQKSLRILLDKMRDRASSASLTDESTMSPVTSISSVISLGAVAPDLVVMDKNQHTTLLKSNALATEGYTHSLLVFYQSGCGYSEPLIQQLPNNYSFFKDNGIRIISLSADRHKEVHDYTSQPFVWSDSYCDYLGFNGINFKNYGVTQVPALFMLDQNGVIVGRLSDLGEALTWVKQEKQRKN